jgi:acetyl-CoA carboxylase biotin carboxyl carrier protein
MGDSSASWDDIAYFLTDAARQMREYGLTSLDVEHAGSRVRIKIEPIRGTGTVTVTDRVVLPVPEIQASDESSSTLRVTSPMIGTFYAAPSPGEPPFVEEGDEVEVGQVIGIIEAMKIMNEITSEHAGIVERILVKNAQPVEYGQPLFEIRPID